MENNFKKVKSIVHIIMLGVGLIFWGIMSNFVCVYCEDYLGFTQFVDSTAAGFVITMFILCVGICCSEELEHQTQMAVSYMGGLFYLISVVCLGLEYDRGTNGVRMLCALVFCSILAVLYFFEAIYITVKNDMNESV